jgi:N-acetylglucosamine-6-phosphate deacetylase
MDFMVRHMHQQVGLDLPTAVRMASLTPAMIIGLQDEIGSLAVGKRADLLFLDAELEITRVFVDGEAAMIARGRV